MMTEVATLIRRQISFLERKGVFMSWLTSWSRFSLEFASAFDRLWRTAVGTAVKTAGIGGTEIEAETTGSTSSLAAIADPASLRHRDRSRDDRWDFQPCGDR